MGHRTLMVTSLCIILRLIWTSCLLGSNLNSAVLDEESIFLARILKWNGTAWTTQPSGTTSGLTSVSGVDANNVWAVGAMGTIVKWNGAAWSLQPSSIHDDLYGVLALSMTRVQAVGNNGMVALFDGSAWSASPYAGIEVFTAIAAPSANAVWAAGYYMQCANHCMSRYPESEVISLTGPAPPPYLFSDIVRGCRRSRPNAVIR